MHVPRMAYSILESFSLRLRLWGQQAELIKEFDKDGDGKLSTEERVSMIQAVSERSAPRKGARQRGSPPTLAPGLVAPMVLDPEAFHPLPKSQDPHTPI